MPFTFNGIGTTLYGARDFQPDGSYTTTEWIVFAWLPVLPIRSMRILPTGNNKNYVFYASSGYGILEKHTPHGKQVLSIYAWFAVVLLLVLFAAVQEQWLLALPALAMLAVPRWLRKKAAQRVRAEYSSPEAFRKWQEREAMRQAQRAM